MQRVEHAILLPITTLHLLVNPSRQKLKIMVTKAGVGVILAGIGEIIGQDTGGGIDRIATIITGPGVQGLSGTEILLSLFMVHTMKVMMVRVRAHAKTNILRMSRREMRARARSDDAHHGILQEHGLEILLPG